MLGLSDYARVKDNFCLCYFGASDEYVVQLRLIRPHLRRRFPGLNIYLSCRDACLPFLGGDDVLSVPQLRDCKPAFAQIYELKFDGKVHPLEALLADCGINDWAVADTNPAHSGVCRIVTQGAYPTKPLTSRETEWLTKTARIMGYEPVEYETPAAVFGVEGVELFSAGAAGLPVFLVPTGVGTKLYKKMFPGGKILHGPHS